jgi:hypothetical protein
VPEEVAAQRKNDHPVELLTERRKVYLDIGRENGMIVLDGLRKPQELELEVWNSVRSVKA